MDIGIFVLLYVFTPVGCASYIMLFAFTSIGIVFCVFCPSSSVQVILNVYVESFSILYCQFSVVWFVDFVVSSCRSGCSSLFVWFIESVSFVVHVIVSRFVVVFISMFDNIWFSDS